MIGEFSHGINTSIILFLFQAKHKETGVMAAAKMCRLETDEDLDDFRVEIDILADCKHPNVVTLFDAFCFDNKLWVSFMLQLSEFRIFITL